MDVTTDWYWEGNIVGVVAKHLSNEGWQILKRADTRSKEQGVDIHASRAEVELLVEAKGYPSRQYRDPRRAGEQKATNPTNQAQHWYSHAVLKALRLQTKYPAAKVALAFPDFPRYRALFSETRGGLGKLRLALLFVKENGEVEEWGLNGQPSTIKSAVTEKDVQKFSDACVLLRAIWEHYKTLFEQGGHRQSLLKTIAPMVFGDIRRMMLEHLVLQICVITDPPESFKRKNLTIRWLLQNCDFAGQPDKLQRLKGLSKRIHEFRDIMLPARNCYISHLDVDSIRLGDTLSAAEDSKWEQFWVDLEDFLEIVYGHYISPNMRLSTIAQMSDAQLLVKALKESTYFHALLESNQTTQLALTAAETSNFRNA